MYASECVHAGRTAPRAQLAGAGRASRRCAPARASPSCGATRLQALPRNRRSVAASAVRGSPAVVRAAVATDAKEQLKIELASGKNRAVINELLLRLEGSNPTQAPTRSPLITGDWEFAYNAGVAPGPVPSPTRPLALAMYAGGFSPGTFGLAVAEMLPKEVVSTEDFKLSIAGMGPYVSTASIRVKLLGRSFSVKVKCDLVAESDRRLNETYKSLEVYGRATEVPASLQYERMMYISYLDEDLMIARDETGAPDVLYRLPAEDGVEVSQNPDADEVPETASASPEAMLNAVVTPTITPEAEPEMKEPEMEELEAEPVEEEEEGTDSGKGKGKKGGKK